MIQTYAVVYIVDDDALVRDALQQLIISVGLKAETFSSAREFLDADPSDRLACLVLDIRMPDMSGLELQQELEKRGSAIPIIFITGHGTVPMSVRAMKAGAVDFIQKPFEDQELLDVIQQALEQNRDTRQALVEIEQIKQRINSLSLREHQVLLEVIDGKLNKTIAYDLNISENTVKTHRSHIMRKMKVNSLAELFQAAVKASIHPPAKINSSNDKK